MSPLTMTAVPRMLKSHKVPFVSFRSHLLLALADSIRASFRATIVSQSPFAVSNTHELRSRMAIGDPNVDSFLVPSRL